MDAFQPIKRIPFMIIIVLRRPFGPSSDVTTATKIVPSPFKGIRHPHDEQEDEYHQGND